MGLPLPPPLPPLPGAFAVPWTVADEEDEDDEEDEEEEEEDDAAAAVGDPAALPLPVSSLGFRWTTMDMTCVLPPNRKQRVVGEESGVVGEDKVRHMQSKSTG